MALSLGASRRRVFRTVTLPLCTPGLANAFLLLFAASLADFATPLILAGNQFPVLPTQAFLQITGLFDLRGGAALSLMLLVPALLVFVVQRYWVGRRYYVTVTGKGAGQAPFDSVTPARALVARGTLRCSDTLRLLSLRAAGLCLAGCRLRGQRFVHVAALSCRLHRRSSGDRRYAHHRRDRDATRRPLRRVGRLPGRAQALRRPKDDGGHFDDQLRAARDDRRHRLPDRLQRPAHHAGRTAPRSSSPATSFATARPASAPPSH